jgi:hypothetical protein
MKKPLVVVLIIGVLLSVAIWLLAVGEALFDWPIPYKSYL